MTKAHPFIDGDRVRKAHSVRSIAPIYASFATGLSAIPELRYIKLLPTRLSASNALSKDCMLAVPLDWSGGFWPRIAQDHPRLCVS